MPQPSASPALVLLAATLLSPALLPGEPGKFAPAVEAASQLPRMRSLLVSHQGKLVLEHYFNGARANRTTNIKSAAKSVISALIGIAIDRQLISGVGAPIGQYFPEYLAGEANAPKRAITIEDLLTMRSGLRSTSGRGYGAWVQSSNWVKYVLDRALVDPPGSRMEYSTGNSHLLSAILTRASGVSTWAFARDHLAKPLGIDLQGWDRDPQGIYLGGNNMAMTPLQMLAFGELYRNRGRANGRQVISESWIEASFIPRGRSHWSDELHGYGWWISDLGGHRTYYAWGYGGQLIFILPGLELVVVTTSSSSTGQTRRSHRRTVFDLVEDYIVTPVHLSHSPAAGSATSAHP